MATPTRELISALRTTAARIAEGDKFMWGNMGACNCGHLAQTITQLTREDIHNFAMERHGDWYNQTLEFCPTSGYPMDIVIQTMLSTGLSLKDLQHLERLNDPAVKPFLPAGKKYLRRNSREDAVLYMKAMADMLEAQLLRQPANIAPQPAEKARA